MTIGRAVLACALALLLGGCLPAAPQATPSPDASSQAAASPPPWPSPLVPPDDLGWLELGRFDGEVNGLIATESGYLAYGYRHLDQSRPWTWWSDDGTNWTATPLPLDGGACAPGSPSFAATDGTAVVLLARDSGCAEPVGWVTPDGKNWQKSEPLGEFDASGNSSDFQVAWWVPGGFEVALEAHDGGSASVWRTTDGLDWTRVADLGPDFVFPHLAAASVDGRRLLAFGGSVLVSDDGLNWVTLLGTAELGARNLAVNGIVAPTAMSQQWLLLLSGDNDSTWVWASVDLVHWREELLPPQEFEQIISTRYGYLALTRLTAVGAHEIYPYIQQVSGDGMTWQPLEASVSWIYHATDGPAGVLAMGPLVSDEPVWPEQTVAWRLQR